MQYDKFGEVMEIEDERINGINKPEMASFIENNQERYLTLFKKNEDKKFFLSINFAAMFLSVYWMFYRKMYKAGILFLCALGIFSVIVSSLALFALKDEILAIKEKANNSAYYASEYATEQYNDFTVNFTNNQNKINQMNNDLNSKLFSYIILPFIIFSLGFGLIADWLYRKYLLAKILYTDGGVSKGAVFGALGLMIIYNFIIDIIQKNIFGAILK